MSYPAFEAFATDRDITFARWRAYMSLQPPFLSHATPTPVKADVLQLRTGLSRKSTITALGWLVSRGYLVVHCRDRRGVPSLTLAYALPEPTPAASTG